MKVSIIVPNYNHARFLEQRLSSIFNQTFQDFEVILLDDASTDGSIEILKRYETEPRVSHLVVNSTNSGSPFKQWQKGIDLAKGKYIWIAESDDWAALEFLENTVRPLKSDDQMVLSYSQSYEVDERGKVLGLISNYIYFTDNRRWLQDFENSGTNEISRYLLNLATIPNASAVVFRKDTIKLISNRYTEMKFCGDWQVWVELLQHGKITFCSIPMNYFRSHNASTRVLDNPEKRKLRLREEISIAEYIDQMLPGIETIPKRLRSLNNQYLTCFKETFLIPHLVIKNTDPLINRSSVLTYFIYKPWWLLRKTVLYLFSKITTLRKFKI